MSGHRKIAGTEEIVWGGRRYRRHPQHKVWHRRSYFMATTAPRTYLHRDVFESVNGPVPEGLHVHHVNGNVDDNTPENLAAIAPQAHGQIHAHDGHTYPVSCQWCHSEFESGMPWAKWCSFVCKGRAQRARKAVAA